jgi:DNA-binding transcriptional ArsR family regulator
MARPEHEPTRAQMWTAASPIRFRILELLRDGPATASQLARRLGESSGTTSYHLRVLARAGAIEEDAERGTRRERWWRRPAGAFLAPTHADAEGRAVATRLFTIFRDRDEEARSRFITGEVSDEWQEAAFFGNWVVALTAEEASELGARLFELVDQYRGRAKSDSSESVLVSVSVLPWVEPATE